ncbi:MAG: DUF2541 family protein [Arenimonas sp.]
MKKIMIAAMTICIGFATTASASRTNDGIWRVGSTKLSLIENDKDVLRFRHCKSGIRAIQLRVSKGRVEIERLWVKYGNGERDNLNVADHIAKGGATRWIDLKGDTRCIKEIGIIGDTERSGDRARVDIWAR